MTAITPAINDQALTVQSYQNKQLNDLKVRHLARFRRIALRLLGNIADAEDAVQDAFLSAFKQLDQFKGQAEMSTWLAAIVINVARMELRRRSPRGQIAYTKHTENSFARRDTGRPQPNPEELCSRQELAERVSNATTQLPLTWRKTFQFLYLHDLSVSETAHLLQVPDGTVKARFSRGRARRKKILRNSLRGKGETIQSTRLKSIPENRPKRSDDAPTD